MTYLQVLVFSTYPVLQSARPQRACRISQRWYVVGTAIAIESPVAWLSSQLSMLFSILLAHLIIFAR
jgi:hypothetical protein